MEKQKCPEVRFKGFIDEWKQIYLKDFGYTFTGLSGKTKDDFGHGDGQFITYMNVFTNTISDPKGVEKVEIDFNQNDVKYGDILFTTSSETPHEVGMSSVWLDEKPNTYLNSFCFGVRPFNNQTPYFLAYLLRSNSIRKQLIFLAQGISRYNISKTKAMEINLSQPCLEERIQIGNFFQNLDQSITLQEKKLTQTQNLKKAMLEKMFPKAGSKQPEIRLKGFSGDWHVQCIGDFTRVGSGARVHKEEWTSSGVPFFRSSDVVSSYKGNDNSKAYISFSLFEKLIQISGRLEKDDLLITGGGSIGIPYLVQNDEPLYSKDADLIWIKKSSKFNSQYLYTFFSTSYFRSFIASISHIGTIAHYTIEQVKATPVCLPSIEEQVQIGNFFKQLDGTLVLQKQQLQTLKNLKQAFLEKMFV
ncbi:restriction endonuclease subunit S [Acinetobacter baumannii]|nr:restriction endonuclease subunit S [Acinetobacter baumannii]